MIINTAYHGKSFSFFQCSYLLSSNSNGGIFIDTDDSYMKFDYKFTYKGVKIQTGGSYDFSDQLHHRNFIPAVFDDLGFNKYFVGASNLQKVNEVCRYLNSGVFLVENLDGKRVPFLFCKQGESIIGYLFLHESLQDIVTVDPHEMVLTYPLPANDFNSWAEYNNKYAHGTGYRTSLDLLLGIVFPYLNENYQGGYSKSNGNYGHNTANHLHSSSPLLFYKYALKYKQFVEDSWLNTNRGYRIGYYYNQFDLSHNSLMCDSNHMKYIEDNWNKIEPILLENNIETEVYYA